MKVVDQGAIDSRRQQAWSTPLSPLRPATPLQEPRLPVRRDAPTSGTGPPEGEESAVEGLRNDRSPVDLTPTRDVQTASLPRYFRAGPSRRVVVPTLRVVAGRDMLRFVTFAPGEVVVIGRDESAELILSDPSVSRRHAKVVCDKGGGLRVYDLGSTNGTAVNGSAIEQAEFLPNDHLEVGAVCLRLDMLSLEEVGHLATVVARLESASRDPLTGLLTRAWVEDELPAMLARSDAEGQPVSAVFLDIDHFKQVNDTFGHGVGDDVLVAVARIVMVSVRDGDPCVRFGGEEIVLFLEGTTSAQAVEVAERVRVAIEGHDWPRTAPGLSVTASLGVATRTAAEPWRTWVARADRALFAAKGAGRNRVGLAPGE